MKEKTQTRQGEGLQSRDQSGELEKRDNLLGRETRAAQAQAPRVVSVRRVPTQQLRTF